MTDKDRVQIKKNIDEMSAKIFDYICAAEPDQEEREHRFIELACSFINATIDYNIDLNYIMNEVSKHLVDVSELMIITAIKCKMSILPDDRKLSEFGGNEND